MSENIEKLSILDHIRQKSMWAGTREAVQYNQYIYENNAMNYRQLTYSPAMFKCITEVIDNAIDQHNRYPDKVTLIKVTFDRNTNEISVYNNGVGIPVVTKTIDNETKYIAEWAFTSPLTGTNFGNNTKNVGGTNGIGVKLTSVYSKYLYVRTSDGKNVFEQKNYGLKVIDAPVITESKTNNQGTIVTFLLDFDYIKFTDFDLLSQLIHTRLVQLSAFTNGSININYLTNDKLDNGTFEEKVKVVSCKNTMSQYVNMFGSKVAITEAKFTEKCTKSTYFDYNDPLFNKFTIGVFLTDIKQKNHSIINGLVVDDGSHLSAFNKLVVTSFVNAFKSKYKASDIDKFVNVVVIGSINNPSFNSQSKERLDSPSEYEFKKFEVNSEKLSSIQNNLLELVEFVNIKKSLNTKVTVGHIADYYPADYCTNKIKKRGCTLIIAEGSSGSSIVNLAVNQTQIKGFDSKYIGSYKLQGVPINGRRKGDLISNSLYYSEETEVKSEHEDSFEESKMIVKSKKSLDDNKLVNNEAKYCPTDKILKNKQLTNLVKILNLNYQFTYDTEEQINTLNYGHLLALCDADLDGDNIVGLVGTYFLTYFPNLIKNGFLQIMQTPLMRVYPKNQSKSSKKKTMYSFNTYKEFDEWFGVECKNDTNNLNNRFIIKYTKGLGGASKDEVPLMFENFNNRVITLLSDKLSRSVMEVYYGPKTEGRKSASKENSLEYEIDKERQSILINNWFKYNVCNFQKDNILRKIPSIFDGLVQARRKVLYVARKYAKSSLVKVPSLASDTIKHSLYQHGDDSLNKVIIRMAQVGSDSNTMPLLLPQGQTGTKAAGYDDASAARYLHVQLNKKLVSRLFVEEDDYLLEYDKLEGETVEPRYYVTVIPPLYEHINNPASGFKIQTHPVNVRDLIHNTRCLIDNKRGDMLDLQVFYKDFKGTIQCHPKTGKPHFIGLYELSKTNKDTIIIKELPPRVYARQYLGCGDDIDAKNDYSKATTILKKYYGRFKVIPKPRVDNDRDVNIELSFKPGELAKIVEETRLKLVDNEHFDIYVEAFNLKKSISYNLNFVNEQNNVVTFNSFNEIVEYWFKARKQLYIERVTREKILLKYMIELLQNQQRFSKQTKDLSRKTEQEYNQILQDDGYTRFNVDMLRNPKKLDVSELEYEILESKNANYDYLMDMTIKQMQKHSYTGRKNEILRLTERLNLLTDKDELFTGAKLWKYEINMLEEVVNKWYDIGFETQGIE